MEHLAAIIERHFNDVKCTGAKIESPCTEGNVKIYRVGNIVRIDVKPPKEV